MSSRAAVRGPSVLPASRAGSALPSLHALHVFEVTATVGSFTRAAAVLGVTQTAVSHQIRLLEEELSTTLFRRGRSVSLTAAGQAWFAELSPVFERLRAVNRRLRQPARLERKLISITTIPSFGARWLVPRLGSFLAKQPDLDLRISTTEAITDFTSEAVDVGIRFGQGPYRGLHAEKLCDDFFVPVAAKSVAARVASPSDLVKKVLLFDDREDTWPRWFEMAGVAAPKRLRYHQLNDSGLLVEIATRGQGVGLARWSLVHDDLAAGRLCILFPEAPALGAGAAYYLVGLRETFRRAEVAAFRAWLPMEFRQLAAAELFHKFSAAPRQ